MAETPTPKERLAFLDVARGLAALLVFVQHSLGDCVPGFTVWSTVHLHLGKIGVILFLIISGFIIPASLEQGGSNARFWLRRAFRLFPAYWFCIFLTFAYVRWIDAESIGASLSDPKPWLINLTMLQGFASQPNLLGVFWTLQLELVIYIACSVLFTLRVMKYSGTILVVALVGAVILGFSRPLLADRPFLPGGVRFLYFAPLVGMVTYRFWQGALGRGSLLTLVAGQFLSWLAIWQINHAYFPDVAKFNILEEIAGTWGPAYACFFLLLAVRSWTMPAVLSWLGRISYSFYLLHVLVLTLFTSFRENPWIFLPLTLLTTLLLSDLAYRCVEVPGIALGRILDRRWFSKTPASTGQIPTPRAAA